MNEVSQSGPSKKLQLAPTETLAQSAAKSITFFHDAMRTQHDAAIAGEIEPVHQLRVSSRRLRAAVELFSGVLYAAALKTYRRDIPWIASQAGVVRNCDVLEKLFKDRADKLEVPLHAALGPLSEAVAAERNTAHAQLVHDLSSRRYANLLARLTSPAIKTARGRAKLGIAAPDLLAPMIRGIRKKGDKLGDDAPAEVFHKLRVRIKRLRYALEMLAALAGKRHRKTLARLEELQELLGTYNDINVAITWLHSFAASTTAPPATILAAGAMIQSLGSRGRKLRAECLKTWQRFDRSEVLEDAIAEISSTARELADTERQAAAAARAAAQSAASAAIDPQPAASPDAESTASPEPLQLAVVREISPAIAIAEDAAPSNHELTPPPPNPDDTEHAA